MFQLRKIIPNNIFNHQKMFSINQSRRVDAISTQKLPQRPPELGDIPPESPVDGIPSTDRKGLSRQKSEIFVKTT